MCMRRTLFVLGMMAAAVVADDCALTDNILTSVGCPTACDANVPCVLYSKSKPACAQTQKAGVCQQEVFVPPVAGGGAAACNVTFQCLDLLMENGRWLLNLDVTSQTDRLTSAPVTLVEQLKFPAGTTIVQFGGGTFDSKVHTVQLKDDSLFNVPTSITALFLTDVDLSAYATKYKIAKQVQYLTLRNTNLQEVPPQFANLTQLLSVDLGYNKINSFLATPSDPLLPAFQKVTALNLSNNALTTFVPNLPALTKLDLSGNTLSKIPDVLFGMSTLRSLSLRRCGLSTVQVSKDQYDFLNRLETLDADFDASSCTNGYGAASLPGNGGNVCVAGMGKSKSHTLPIVLGIVGAVIVLAIVGFVIYRRREKRSKPFETNDNESVLKPSTATYGQTDYERFSEAESTSVIWSDADLQAARIDFRDVEPLSLLSRGGFGEVWLGEYMGQKVAIKRLLSDKRKMTDVLAFAQEIKTMARLDHPKIVQFIGVCWSNAQNIQAVTEYMDCGDLRALLDSPKASSLTWSNLKCQIAIDIADALVYMHTLDPKLIHRDLKSRNVLIDANTGAKLSDFGISRNRSMEETMTAGVGTARWIAPEVILGGHYTEFADIYSFGVVLSELDTSKTPYHDATNTNGGKMQDVTILQLVSAGKLQPSFSPTCPRSILTLAQACLSFSPAQRPSAIHITYELRKILKEEL